MRAWELYTTPSVCPGCATGCNIEVHHSRGKVYRLVPRENQAVNKYWMCDEGRFTYKRIARPSAWRRRASGGAPVDWDQALDDAGRALSAALDGDAEPASASCSTRSRPTRISTRWRGWRSITCTSARRTWPASTRAGATTSWCRADKNPNTAGAHGDRRGPAAQRCSISPNDLKAGAVHGAAGRRRRDGVLGDGTAPAALPLDQLQALVVDRRRTGTRVTDAAHVALPLADVGRGRRHVHQQAWAWSSACAPRVPPAGDSLPGWEILVAPGAQAGRHAWTSPRPKAVFAEAKQKLPFMKDADWGRPMLPVQLRFAELARLTPTAMLQLRPARLPRRSRRIDQDPVHDAGLPDAAGVDPDLAGAAAVGDDAGPPRARTAPTSARSSAWGITHFLADAVKFIFKEDFVPAKAHKFLFMLAPIMAMAPALIVAAIIPFGAAAVLGRSCSSTMPPTASARSRSPLQIARLDVGLLFYFAISSLAVYGATLAGWASYNKWALMGGLRASSQMMSYEVTMGMAVLGAFLVYGTLEPGAIVAQQTQSRLRHLGRAGASSRSRSASSCSSPRRSPRPSARRSTSPRASRRSSATSSSTRACASACSSWASSSRSSSRARIMIDAVLRRLALRLARSTASSLAHLPNVAVRAG